MSPLQLRKDYRKETFSAPQFVYPIAIGSGLAVSALALGMGAVGWALVALGAGAILGSGGWATLRQFFWRDRLLYERMLKLQENMLRQIEEKRSGLQRDLAKLRDHRGAEQLENLTAKFQLVSRRLRERFDPSEVTFVRYVGTAEQVYLGALDNLRAIVEVNQSLETMNRERLAKRRDELFRGGQESESQVIHERVEMFDRYQERIHELLSANEAAITRLSQVLEALVNLNTGQSLAREPLDQAMEELSRLARRTGEYGV
jgi:hypothetical protein